MAKPFQPTPHPVHPVPTAAQACAIGDAAYKAHLLERERLIALEKADPLRNYWEPPIWWVCDCLLGLPWIPEAEAMALRKALNFPKPVRILTILGGNRSSKTQYCVTRALRLMTLKEGVAVWFWHQSFTMSIDTHQVEFRKYLPPELKVKDMKSEEAYIAYKRKTGFTDHSFILPPRRPKADLSWIRFKSYGESTVEGIALDLVVLDELTGSEASHADVAETIPLRTSDRNGIVLKPFTPVSGYSQTVRMDLDGAVAVKESTGFLCPTDGREPRLDLALGLTSEDLAELETAEREGRAAHAPESVPEDCRAWVRGASGQPPVPAGREFARVPRVLKCLDPEERKAVIFFHSGDNPYGRARHVYARTVATRSADWFVKERLYGVANKLIEARFSFNADVHTVAPEEIPPPEACTNYHLGDPHSRRNMAMGWFSVTPEHDYLRREWPGDYYIPEVGHPGPWAIPGRKPDGAPGPAQKPFGFGLRDYKREIARLEGWKDYQAERPPEMTDEDWSKAVDNWSELNGTREAIEGRELDARFASTPRMEKDRPVTLLTEFEDIGLFFNGMPGDDIDSGLIAIDDALSYARNRPVDYWNKPRLLISRECKNTIYALETWTGLTEKGLTDRDGATKEWIDLLKGFFLRPRPFMGGRQEPETEMKHAYY